MDWRDHIERRPDVMLGKPVELILERLGDGWSEDDLVESYPHLENVHIRAAQAFAAAAYSPITFTSTRFRRRPSNSP